MLRSALHRLRLIAAGLACLLALVSSRPAAAIPGKILISGQLLDQSGNPVHYTETTSAGTREISVNLAARVMLFDSATEPQAFAIIPTTATAYNAYFNISFNLPDSAVTKDSLWYALSIDVANNGLSANDFFPERFEIGSVPFALSARPVTSFTTFSGYKGQATDWFQDKNIMMVVPFETPAGGVEFNRMNTFISQMGAGSAISFGIYDEDGKLVASSGRITTKVEILEAFLQIKHVKMKLQPAKIYYVGVAHLGQVFLSPGLRPVSPTLGTVWTPFTDGSIPSSFDPQKIDPDEDVTAMPVTLSLADDSVTSGSGWVQSKPGFPQFRWIPAKHANKKKTVIPQ